MNEFVLKKYQYFYEKYGYIPKYFQPYNCMEITDICTTISCQSGVQGHIGNILIVEVDKDA